MQVKHIVQKANTSAVTYNKYEEYNLLYLMLLFIPCYPPYSNDFIGISEGDTVTGVWNGFAFLRDHSQRVPVLLWDIHRFNTREKVPKTVLAHCSTQGLTRTILLSKGQSYAEEWVTHTEWEAASESNKSLEGMYEETLKRQPSATPQSPPPPPRSLFSIARCRRRHM